MTYPLMQVRVEGEPVVGTDALVDLACTGKSLAY